MDASFFVRNSGLFKQVLYICISVCYWEHTILRFTTFENKMRRTLFIVFSAAALLFGTSAFSQDIPDEDQPMVDNRMKFNVFGGFLAEPGSFNQELSLSMGATIGLTYLDHIYLGGYYVALVSQHFRSDIEIDSVHRNTEVRGSFNHGGIIAGYILRPQKLMNVNFNVRAGWGKIWYFDPKVSNNDRLEELYGVTRDRVFVLTPGVEYTITPISWLRIGIGLGYHAVFGFDKYNNADYDSWLGTISICFGNFQNKPVEYEDDETETEGQTQP
jgi:hypothetical protein